MEIDQTFNGGLARLGRSGFHLLRGRNFLHWFWQGKFPIKNTGGQTLNSVSIADIEIKVQSLLRREQFCEIPILWAYNFGTVRRKKFKISLKNPKFIRDSVKQIKKYGHRVKNRSYLRFCLAKSGFLDVNNEKCYFLTQEKTTITNFSEKINYTGVKRISWKKY
jgi:hypothetical protein